MRIQPAAAFVLLSLAVSIAALGGCASQPVAGAEPQNRIVRQADGIVLATNDGWLRVQVRADDIVRVSFAKKTSVDQPGFDAHPSLAVLPSNQPAPFWKLTDGNPITLTTARLQVRIDATTGAVSFLDLDGKPILTERNPGRTLEETEDQDEPAYHVRQQWEGNDDESLYGLGENQLDLTDIKGYDLDLWQHNGSAAVPMLVSGRGYGILWDNTSYTRFGDIRSFAPIPSDQLSDVTGQPGGLTATLFVHADFTEAKQSQDQAAIDVQPTSRRNSPTSRPQSDFEYAIHSGSAVSWEGNVTPSIDGFHEFRTYSNGGIKVWLDGKLAIDHWRQGWLPWYDIARIKLSAGKPCHVKVQWNPEGNSATVQLLWKPPTGNSDEEAATSLWSQIGDGIDYYFIYGPSLDHVIGGYRQLTGPAPMLPAWAMGLWQSRQHYSTSKQSLDVVKGYRSRNIPLDVIVQDWQYWHEGQWGSHIFDRFRFPDPVGWIEAIHQLHSHLLISVWPKFDHLTDNFKAMNRLGFLYQQNLKENLLDFRQHISTFYDAFNPEARKLFWQQVNQALFSKHVDSWWLDSDEPDMTPTPTLEQVQSHMNPTALGSGARMLNAYPLVHCEAVYEGQRQAAPNQRVLILSRSAFLGQQRYATAVWSGDTSATWTAMRKQIPAGISFCLSGIPYWSMDSGGFSVPHRFSAESPSAPDVDEWRELNTRWFEFAAFCPILRVHGEFPNREMWEFGGETSDAYKAQLQFDILRYRLLPYIYSLCGQVTQENGTMMRGLVMDFPNDTIARQLKDEYMFGPAFLVCPVTSYQARTRSVYLPKGTQWRDFWTGRQFEGGQTIDAPAPLDRIPIFLRAGSIVPLTDPVQYVGEKPADPITLMVCQGADGQFTLYEDDGTTYDYENGKFAKIPLRWDETNKNLTIGNRQGEFPGMLATRTFCIAFVSGASGWAIRPPMIRQVTYTGDEIVIHGK